MSLMPYDLAKVLQPYGIRQLLNVICTAYAELYDDKIISTGMEEVQISEELFIRVQEYFYKNSIPLKINHITLSPHYEKYVSRIKPQGKFPSIDICFRDKYNPDVFFGAECKILNDDKIETYSLYVSKGVDRYLTGKYYGNSSHSSMIGYVLKGSNNKVTQELNKRMLKKTNVQIIKSYKINKFDDHYTSKHDVDFSESIILHHIILSFV